MTTKLTARTALAVATIMSVAAFSASCSQPKHAGSPLTATSRAVAPVVTSTTMNVPGVGQVALDEAIAGKYQQFGGESALGLPTGQPTQVGNGTSQAFAKGTIYSSPSTGAHVVRGDILNIYLSHGGPSGELGFPTSDEFIVCRGPTFTHGGWGNEFQNGYVWWLNEGDQNQPVFQGFVTKKGEPSQGKCAV